MITISVIICTYNREKYIANAIKSILHQNLNYKILELIIVDNNSNDKTPDIVKKIIKSNPEFQMKLIFEKKQGLGFARNRGLKESKGEYITYLDDDAWADGNWIKYIQKCIDSISPKPLVIGGKILPQYVGNKPNWFKDEYESFDLGDKGRYLIKGESFSGSNMVFRKDVLYKYHGFSTDVGMKGDIISVGEETLVFERIWMENAYSKTMYYCPKLLIYHFIPNAKLSVKYRLYRSYISGQALYERNINIKLLFKLRLLLKYLSVLLIFTIISPFRLIISKYPERWLVDSFTPVFYSIGFLLRTIGSKGYMIRIYDKD
ncbi:MAG: glycosyltransferase family 2 protein [Bacteroidota bacterium]